MHQRLFSMFHKLRAVLAKGNKFGLAKTFINFMNGVDWYFDTK